MKTAAYQLYTSHPYDGETTIGFYFSEANARAEKSRITGMQRVYHKANSAWIKNPKGMPLPVKPKGMPLDTLRIRKIKIKPCTPIGFAPTPTTYR